MILPVLAYGVAALFFVVFLAIYWARTDWWRRVEGWCLSATILVLTLNCGLAISVILFGEYPGVGLVRVVASILVAVVAVGAVIALDRAQRTQPSDPVHPGRPGREPRQP